MIFDHVSFGQSYMNLGSDGWINTQGALGEMNYEGTFWGYLGIFQQPKTGYIYYIGIKNFIGLRYANFYMGNALRVKIGTTKP